MKVEVKQAKDVKVGERLKVFNDQWETVADLDENKHSPDCITFILTGGYEIYYEKDMYISVAIPDASEQPKEKTYTREEVAKVLCPMCAKGKGRIKGHGYVYFHPYDKLGCVCQADTWLKATEGGEG
jgi:hypothetical protein